MHRNRSIGESARAGLAGRAAALATAATPLPALGAQPPATTPSTPLLIAVLLVLATGLLATAIQRRRRRDRAPGLPALRFANPETLSDPLTGLPTRMLFYDQLQRAVTAAGDRGESLAILVIDVNDLKSINHRLGHQHGDAVLRTLSNRLRTLVRRSDTAARLDGDEFALLLPTANRRQAEQVAGKIIQALDAPYLAAGQSIHARANVGIALFPEHSRDASVLLQRADGALQLAKRADREYAVYEAALDRDELHRLPLASELRTAIENDQLELDYQPKLDFHSGDVTAVEALVRWNHPTRGRIPPADFIPIAEQSGLIQRLTLWVIKAALDQCAQWQAGGVDLKIALNLSAHDLQDATIIDAIAHQLAHKGLQSQCLEVEITESAMMMNSAVAAEMVARLAAMGVRIAIDDFGTGYSSLAYLKKLPVNTIKIDKSFVLNMDRDDNDAIIVRATIDLAHNLGLRVVAEGVENRDALDLLRVLGCDTVQGFLISRPIAGRKVAQWLCGWKSTPELVALGAH